MQNPDKLNFLVELATHPDLHKGNAKKFINHALEKICKELEANRVGFWFFQNKTLKNYCTFNLIKGKGYFSKENEISKHISPSLFEIFSNDYFKCIILDANDDNLDDDTFNFLCNRKTITWLSAQIWHAGKPIGIINFEWNNLKEDIEQLTTYLLSISSISSQAYDALMRKNEKSLKKNESKEKADEKLENLNKKLEKKLKDHAVYTSHSLRHPLSSMLGIMTLIDIKWDDREKYVELLQQLKNEIHNLDDILRVMTAKVEIDEILTNG